MIRMLVWLTHPLVGCWNFTPRHRRMLARELPPGVTVRRCGSQAAFLRALPGAAIAVVWRFEPAWLQRAPRLQWIATPSAGRDYFHVDPPPGLHISYGTFHGPIMAETVLGMMLGVARGLFDRLREPAAGEPWPRETLAARMTRLHGSRVTLLGFGRIGQAIGRSAKAMGAVVTGIRRRSMPLPPGFAPPDRCLTIDHLDAVLPETDHLVLALPGGPQTDGLMNAQRLARLPAHAVVYNVGRGNALDERALADALHAGRLRAACLDVFAREPLARGHPLWDCPRTLTLPHVSAVAPDYLDRYVAELVREVRQWKRGQATDGHHRSTGNE